MKKLPGSFAAAKTFRLWQLCFLFFLVSNVLHAQTWSPHGATWYYNYMNFAFFGYSQIQYTGDTVINSITCKKLDRSMHGISLNQFQDFYLGREYTYEQNGVVYLYFNNHFDTLFNFNASIGESWRLAKQPGNTGNMCDSNSTVTVLDTGTFIINSVPLRFMAVQFQYGSSMIYPDTIIEKIGPVFWYMLPYDMCMIDGNQGGPLRCYSDSSFGTYHHNYSNNCDFIIGEPEINARGDLISVYPNPVRKSFTIDLRNTAGFAIEEVEIYSSIGEKIFSQKQTAYSQQKKINVDTHSWSVGVYFVRVKSESGIVVKKLVKQ